MHSRARIAAVAAALAILTGCTASEAAPKTPSLTVATFNVRYVSAREGLDEWRARAPSVGQTVRDLDADLIGFQEMETFDGGHSSDRNVQLYYLLDAFPGYQAAATGDPSAYPSTQPVLYRPARLSPVEQGFFFFSPTPDEIYARPWHGRFPAFASWVRFKDAETGVRFVVVNVHFDARNVRDRLRSARLVAERIEAIARDGEPVVVLGDFNAPAFFPTMRILARSGLHRAPARGSTFHFGSGVHLVPAIDHVLGSARVVFEQAAVVRSEDENAHPSDHHPVRVRLRFRQ